MLLGVLGVGVGWDCCVGGGWELQRDALELSCGRWWVLLGLLCVGVGLAGCGYEGRRRLEVLLGLLWLGGTESRHGISLLY